MMADIESKLNVAVTTSGVDVAKKSLADLTKAGASAEKVTDELGRTSRQTGNDLNRAASDTNKLARETTNLNRVTQQASSAFASYGKTLGAGLIAGASLSALARLTDEYTKLSGQLKIATESQVEFNKAFSDVRRIATQSQSDLGTVSALYSRLSLSLREIGVSSGQVASITETVSLALKASGAGAGETASTMLQLSQAFGSGVLRGEEFNAVMEASPNLMRALAQSIGVPVGKLRALAAEGQITSDVLVKAFSDESLLNNFRDQARQVQTISGAMTTLKNSLTLLGGELNNQTGAGSAFSTILVQIARSIEGLAQSIKGDLKGSIDALLPSYDKYLQARKQQLEDEKKIAGISRQQIIPQGQRLGQISIPGAGGTISESNTVFAQLKKQFDDLAKTNPLKDVTAATQEYAQKVAIVRANMLAMNITQDEGNRYLAQFKKELDASNSAQDKKNKLQESAATKQKAATDSLIESARRISPVNDNDIAYLQRKLDATIAITGEQRKLIQAEIDAATARKDAASDDSYINSMLDYATSVQAVVDNLRESVLQQQDENKVRLGLVDSVDTLVIARKEEKLEMLKSLGAPEDVIDLLQKEIDLRKQLKDQTDQGKRIEENKRAEQERVRATEQANAKIKQDVERTSESINKSLTDALLRGFERGKSFAENFRNTLINMFKTLVLQPAISFILSPITNAVAQGVEGIVGTANSIFSNLSNVFTTSNQSIISGIEGIGATIANGMGGIRDTIGGFIGANASTLANASLYAGAVLQLAQGNIAGAAGTAIGTYFGGPVGGAIGSFLGNAVGSIFGGKKRTPRYSSGVNSTFSDGVFSSTSIKGGISGFNKNAGGQEGLSSAAKVFSTSLDTLLQSYGIKSQINASLQFYKRKGAWGAAQISVGGVQAESVGGGSNTSIYSKDAQTAFNNLITAFLTTGFSNAVKASTLPEGLKGLFDGFTDQTQIAAMIQAVMTLSKAQDGLTKQFGLTASQAGLVAQASGLSGEELTAFVNSISAAGIASMTSGEQLVQFRDTLTEQLGGTLYTDLQAFDAALKGIDKTTTEGIQSFYDLFSLRDEFAQFQASLGNLKGGVRSALLGIVSESDRQSMLQSDLAELFDNLNLTLPTSIDELIALGKSIDYTTAEGLTLASVFPSLVSAFTQANEVIAELTKTTDDFATNFEYLRYQALKKNYGQTFANKYVPSFDVGTNYVPSDGLAMIHQGERIIPAADNQHLMQNSSDMVQEIRELRSDVNKLNYAMQSAAVNTAKTAKSLDNIERGGVIISDIGIDGNEQVLKVEVVA
jgi:tape measure domain-containing protein